MCEPPALAHVQTGHEQDGGTGREHRRSLTEQADAQPDLRDRVGTAQPALLRYIAVSEGRSQRAIGKAMRIPESRIVALVDALEQRRLLERRPRSRDRRAYARFLTREGRRMLGRVMEASTAHEEQLCAGLTATEQRELVAILRRVAAAQNLLTGVHPGIAETESGRRKNDRASMPSPRSG
ncbi:MAG TPA: MarR family winged helix-turn-helix transcriptional regulator [bacterium]|nr:MarR family winged helix-turn-helix transcriptional regulator [bacterium]